MDHHAAGSYHRLPIEEGGSGKPDCRSHDGVHGVGDPGGICRSCALHEFGSAKRGSGKACREFRILYVLREGNVLPERLQVPATSIQAITRFLADLTVRGVPHYGAVVTVGTERAKNSAGIAYLKMTFTLVHVLPPEQAAIMREYSKKFRAQRLAAAGAEDPNEFGATENE